MPQPATGFPISMTISNTRDITPELIEAHGLKPDEYQRILELIGREPTFTELGIFSAMWNEHCSYKSSKKWLRTLPTSGPRVIQGPGENAGVVDIGDGDCVVFKMESHNHPPISSLIRVPRPAWAESCATCSPWARAPLRQ